MWAEKTPDEKRKMLLSIVTALLLSVAAAAVIGTVVRAEKRAAENRAVRIVTSHPESEIQTGTQDGTPTEGELPTEPSGESEASEPVITANVLYYGEVRLGELREGVSFEDWPALLVETLGEACAPDRELTLRNEPSDGVLLGTGALFEGMKKLVLEEETPACGLYLGGTLVGASHDEETALSGVEEFISAVEEGYEKGSHAQLRNLTFGECRVRKGELLGSEEVAAVLSLCSDIKTELTVDRGKLASYFAGYPGDILPGTEIVKCAIETVEERSTIERQTVTVEDDKLLHDSVVVESEGSDGVLLRRYEVYFENGVEISRTLSEESVEEKAFPRIIRTGTMPDGTATGTFIWTTGEGYISSLFGSRYLFGEWSTHNGIDIAIDTGTPLYAGDGGTVKIAGDNGNGYGTYVMIDHENGFKTIYGHMSKVAVEVEQKVNKGDLIGYSGATGRVTGPHVHYEFRYNDNKVNPLDYLPER